MDMKKLLEENSKSAIVIKQWGLDKLLESLKDDSLPEDFKEYVRSQEMDNDKIISVLETNPRATFDFFDDHKVYIEITVDELGGFWWKIGEAKSPCGYEFRINCDKAAIEEAFKQLEAKL